MPLDRITLGPDQPSGALVWLHGLGADGHDFAPIVPVLGRPDLRVVLPHAPVRPVTINRGYPCRAWYDIRDRPAGQGREDPVDVRTSALAVNALIQEQRDAGLPADRIAVVGFSQGGAMALHVALRWPERLAAVVALSTYLVLPEALDAELSPAAQGLPAFFGHGTQDGVVPMARGRAAFDRLDGVLDATWQTWPMPHSVHPDEIDALVAFLDRVLPAP